MSEAWRAVRRPSRRPEGRARVCPGGEVGARQSRLVHPGRHPGALLAGDSRTSSRSASSSTSPSSRPSSASSPSACRYCIIAGQMDLSIELVLAFVGHAGRAHLRHRRRRRRPGTRAGRARSSRSPSCSPFGALVGRCNGFLVVHLRHQRLHRHARLYIVIRGLALVLSGGALDLRPADATCGSSPNAACSAFPLLVLILIVVYVFFALRADAHAASAATSICRRQPHRAVPRRHQGQPALSIRSSSCPACSPPSPAGCWPRAPTGPRPISASACCSRSSPRWSSAASA